jgi:hypothetical protein
MSQVLATEDARTKPDVRRSLADMRRVGRMPPGEFRISMVPWGKARAGLVAGVARCSYPVGFGMDERFLDQQP